MKLAKVGQAPPKALGVFALAMISVSAIIALQGLPSLAKNGLSVISILVVAAVCFFIPIAFVCAELASGWPQNGGVYVWVKEAFGEQAGSLAIWLEWGGCVIWLPTILSFIASSLAYSFYPPLLNNSYVMLGLMLAILWGATFFNFLSMKTSGWMSTLGILAGSILPACLIILLGSLWAFKGQPLHIQFQMQFLLPDCSFSSLAYLAAVALGFAGIEVAAFYIQDIEDPARTFPKATFISAFLIIVIYLFGSLTIAMVVPKEELDLASGILQTMQMLCNFIHFPLGTSLFALLSAIGGLALLNTWLVGPSKGLLSCAANASLPKFTSYTNHQGSPVAILLVQAIVGTLLVSTYLLVPTINQFYWLFQTQAAQVLLLMYLMIFLSVIKLRYTQPNVVRPYQIPGGKWGLWIIAGSGILFCLIAFLLGLVPPEEYEFLNEQAYAFFLLGGIALFCAPVFIFQRRRKKDQQKATLSWGI